MGGELPRVAGFRFAGIACGIKASGGLDLGLIVADERCAAAALFTTNRVRAAPVELAAARVRRGRARAVLVNSGNANACTGREGDRAARATTAAVAHALGAKPKQVLPASTGVIGRLLPADKIEARAAELVAALSPDGADAFSRAILTTDRGPKTAVAELELGRSRRATFLGIAKGAGMIRPDLATTLAFVVTDAPVAAPLLRRALRYAADRTFHRISVDGDTSTNDMLLAMASGAVGGKRISSGRGARAFEETLCTVLDSLARQIVADGEGAEHVVRIEVAGAPDEGGALRVASTIGTSLLVKTALHGCDPNWGRILAAAGRAGVRFDPECADVFIGDVPVYRGGVPGGADVDAPARAVMKRPEYAIRVDLHAGRAEAAFTTCDLGHAYVTCNAEYRT